MSILPIVASRLGVPFWVLLFLATVLFATGAVHQRDSLSPATANVAAPSN